MYIYILFVCSVVFAIWECRFEASCLYWNCFSCFATLFLPMFLLAGRCIVLLCVSHLDAFNIQFTCSNTHILWQNNHHHHQHRHGGLYIWFFSCNIIFIVYINMKSYSSMVIMIVVAASYTKLWADLFVYNIFIIKSHFIVILSICGSSYVVCRRHWDHHVRSEWNMQIKLGDHDCFFCTKLWHSSVHTWFYCRNWNNIYIYKYIKL